MPYLLQLDFPMDDPFGTAMADAFAELAESITTNPTCAGSCGRTAATRPKPVASTCSSPTTPRSGTSESNTERLEGFGSTDIRSKIFEINDVA